MFWRYGLLCCGVFACSTAVIQIKASHTHPLVLAALRLAITVVLLAPVFAHMDARHAEYVADFVAEVFGGPTAYSEKRGGHAHMIARHLGRQLTQEQRRRWVNLLLDCADEVGLPDDPEFRSAFVAYLEWGSRLAVLNSQPGAAPDTLRT